MGMNECMLKAELFPDECAQGNSVGGTVRNRGWRLPERKSPSRIIDIPDRWRICYQSAINVVAASKKSVKN